MRSEPCARMIVVRKEDKEPKLRAFIAAYLDRQRAGPGTLADVECLLVARSADSPVVKALAAIMALETGFRLMPRVLLTAEDADASSGRSAILTDLSIELRLSRDVRLLEAHEQLVLGNETVWIGDCMRRDPTNRDAFETYVEAGLGAASTARQAFERLWRAVGQTDAAPEASPMATIATALSILNASSVEPRAEPASTRH